jgi:hypothetical protein
MFGYIIERQGVGWNERFWFDIPAMGVKGFGADKRARVFATEESAEAAVIEIDKELGYHCYVTKLSDLYPPLP